jgi:hypothetical protein
LAESDSDSEPKLPVTGVLPQSFATIDTDRREHAIAVLNVETLVLAIEAVEEEANKPEPTPVDVIPNSDAFGLQQLVAATEVQQQKSEVPQSDGQAVEADEDIPPAYKISALPAERMSIDLLTSPAKSMNGKGKSVSRIRFHVQS